MPAFSTKHGGPLSERQIAVLADQMEALWSRRDDSAVLPLYSAEDAGDVQRGDAAFRRYCARCHGADGGSRSIVDRAYLSLISDQSLRTIVIVGRSDQGHPDWRSYVPGQAMKPQEISDVVAWLSARRGVVSQRRNDTP